MPDTMLQTAMLDASRVDCGEDSYEDDEAFPRHHSQQQMPTDCNPPALVIDYDKIVQEFLTGMKLRKVLAHMCNNASAQVTDPISDVVTTMLTCPVHMVVSEVRGIAARSPGMQQAEIFMRPV